MLRFKRRVQEGLIMIGKMIKAMFILYNNKMKIKLNSLEKIIGWIIWLTMNGKAIRLSCHQVKTTKGQIIKIRADERLKCLSLMWRRFLMNYLTIQTTLTFLMEKINDSLQPRLEALVASSIQQSNTTINLMPSTKQITL
jgi:hypothetical protein